MSWWSGLEDICQLDAPLADLTWYRLGGPARWLFTPTNEGQLAEILRRCRDNDVPWRVLGRGANILVRDEGVDAAVIHLAGASWEQVTWHADGVTAVAGAEFPHLVKQAAERGLAGLEPLAGIPGSVGGIIRMNAGGRYGEICEVLAHARVMDSAGEVSERSPEALGMAYRHTELAGCIVLGGTFRLHQEDSTTVMERFQRIWKEKHANQPAMSKRSSGCIFKNPATAPAGKLIDEADLKGTRSANGMAEISTVHANFIVARAGARTQDVLDLIALAQRRVQEHAGVALELEVEIW